MIPAFVHDLLSALRRRGLAIGVDDCDALRDALAAGIGWASQDSLRELCVALWATSRDEATVIRAVFAGVGAPTWEVPLAPAVPTPVPAAVPAPAALPREAGVPGEPGELRLEPLPGPAAPAPPGGGGLPPLPLLTGRDPTLVLLPQFPVTERQVAQTWRRLRRARREGPATELDADATLARYAATGLAAPPVLVPPRRNTASLVLLLDRGGSMAPFHDYVDHIVAAIRRAGRLDSLLVGYFHDTAGDAGAAGLLAELPDPFDASVDAVLDRVAPLHDGRLYSDADLTVPLPYAEFLEAMTPRTAVAVVSDAGAVRGALSPARILDTVALLKTLTRRAATVAWLNPAQRHRWGGTTAEQVARHVPMAPLTAAGMHQTVDVLRGHPPVVERPL
ncbi:VWA domain-containing protein [Dactylosporangium sp. NPDC005555]|uniref:VWA domain-containing protein n=1 Tax=Dactylosporangium sp. NPDC005555 TaxID=3154889 RepID=UPI0033AC5E60